MLKKHILSKYGSKYNIQKMEMFSVNDDGRTTHETRTVEISDTDEKIVSRTKQKKEKTGKDKMYIWYPVQRNLDKKV